MREEQIIHQSHIILLHKLVVVEMRSGTMKHQLMVEILGLARKVNHQLQKLKEKF